MFGTTVWSGSTLRSYAFTKYSCMSCRSNTAREGSRVQSTRFCGNSVGISYRTAVGSAMMNLLENVGVGTDQLDRVCAAIDSLRTRRKAALLVFPTPVTGNSVTNSTRSGTLKD